MLPERDSHDGIPCNSSNTRSLGSRHDKRVQSVHINRPLNRRIAPQILIRRKRSRVRRRLLRKVKRHGVLPCNSIPVRPVLQGIRLREIDQLGQIMDIRWIDEKFVKVICNVCEEIDFVDNGAVGAGVVGCVTGEIGVVHDCCTETLEDGDGVVESNDFRPVGEGLRDCGSGDPDFGAEEGVGDTSSGVIGDDTPGKGDCRGIIILLDQMGKCCGDTFGSTPAMTLRITAASLTVRAIGPMVS